MPNLYAIHSIDSISKAEKICKFALKAPPPKHHKINIYLQVNVSGEATKHGFKDVAELNTAIKVFKESANVNNNFHLAGLMSIGECGDVAAKRDFSKMVCIRSEIDPENVSNLHLSMGMSQDFIEAIKFGSSCVRIGSRIFGDRMNV